MTTRPKQWLGVGFCFLLATFFSGSVNAADADPMRAVVEQAVVLDTAPKLASGSLELDGNVLAEGAFVWIEVEQDGLYSLSMTTPGALVLGSFPTVDGRYDGKVRPGIHKTASSLTEAPVLAPLLLSTSHPYLLSASSSAGTGTLQLTLLEAAPALSAMPPNKAQVLAGDTLYPASASLSLAVPGDSQPRRIEVIGEPRAKLRATLGGLTVPTGGRYPWLSEDDATLRITTTTDAASAPPIVLVRMAANDVKLDESEPNEKTPSSLELGVPFDGHLLQGDRDRLAFALEEDMNLELSISIDQSGEFAVDLLSISGKQDTLLLRRKRLNGTVTDAALSLTAGQYALLLSRADRKDVPLPYSVMLAQGPAARPNREAEPNDTMASAMPLPDSLRVSGAATPQDLDVYRFTVPDDKVGHLWRVFAMDAQRIELADDDGRVADVSIPSDEAVNPEGQIGMFPESSSAEGRCAVFKSRQAHTVSLRGGSALMNILERDTTKGDAHAFSKPVNKKVGLLQCAGAADTNTQRRSPRRQPALPPGVMLEPSEATATTLKGAIPNVTPMRVN